ncbi:MAG: hypothetical protein HOP12_02400 [Candidatus Eisenbacteria bacterium]|uniref:T9SS type A sorting domain-containing protein n=1 Tax=Eiseniibacteriota bacterium TaxID=2212470 RepID=A0A849SEU4_UNCEI|nr:hypothetical protein [Candidatus Eisenbacteria bacterium]
MRARSSIAFTVRAALPRLAALLTLAATCGGFAPVALAGVNYVTLRALSGGAGNTLVPLDTFYVDVGVSDGLGFRNVSTVTVDLSFAGADPVTGGPAFGAEFRWTRSGNSWTRLAPGNSTWQILPTLCDVDASANSNSTQRVRFALVIGAIARGSSTGQWSISGTSTHLLGLLPSTGTTAGVRMAPSVELTELTADGWFAPASAGATEVPITLPQEGSISASMRANTPYRLGVVGDSLQGGVNAIPPSQIKWSSSTGASGSLSIAGSDLIGSQLADTDEGGQKHTLTLTLDVPIGTSGDVYTGPLEFVGQSTSGVATVRDTTLLHATIASVGFAADSVVAEMQPLSVIAGSIADTFVTYAHVYPGFLTTGVNRFRIALPAGYANPRLIDVRSTTGPIAFEDRSTANYVESRLLSTVTVSKMIELHFVVDAPTLGDAVGKPFPVFYEDTTGTLGFQAAIQGNANGLIDADSWTVRVSPGSLATIAISPNVAALATDSSMTFRAAAVDAHGNEVLVPIAWQVLDGLGTVDGSGQFTALSPGIERVVAGHNGVSDTAVVTITANSPEVRVVALPQSAATLVPGQQAEVFRFRVVNAASEPETLVAVRFQSRTAGTGTVAQLDADWSVLELMFDDGSVAAPGFAAPAPLASAGASGGLIAFTGFSLVVPAKDSVVLFVRGGPSLVARDSDALDLRIENAAAVTVLPATVMRGSFPLDPAGTFAVDGMSAAQIQRFAVPINPLTVGAVRHLALDFRVPPNGYASDVLQRLNVVNLGTARAALDLAAMEAWADDGDGAFDALADARLGALTFTGDRWELTGLARALGAGGVRVFVTVSIAESAAEDSTVRLGLPSSPDPALGVQSGNDGPVDVPVNESFEAVISTVDRVVFAASAIKPHVCQPGQPDVSTLELLVTNRYTTDRTLTTFAVRNRTLGPGNAAELDGEIDRVALRLDGDDDGVLDDPATDPLLGAASLVGGRASFTGLSCSLPAGATRRLFVTLDVSASGAADGDQLDLDLEGPAAVDFDVATAVSAAWPVSSGGRGLVDGMRAIQLANRGAPALTLGPNDGPIRVLDVVIPRNGYRDDVLQAVRLENRGSAGAAEIAELRLWRDGGDGAFDAGSGDDAALGPLTLFNGAWQSPFLSEPITLGGARLFASITVSGTPADSSTVQLAIPMGGIAMASDNSGPLDRAVVNAETQVLSSAPLLTSLAIEPSASTPSQPLVFRMTVRNTGNESIQSVTPTAPVLSGSATAGYVSGPTPASVDLAPGEQRDITWSWLATGAGELRFSSGVTGTGTPSGLPRRSLTSTSGLHRVFVRADSLGLFATASLPGALSRGQAGVTAYSLTLTHPGFAGASAIRVTGLRVHLEAEDGSPVVPAELLSRIEVFEGATIYLSRTALETSGGDLDLTLATPFVVQPGEPVTLGLRLDVSSSTVVPNFRVRIANRFDFTAEDATSGALVLVTANSPAYPIVSGVARVGAPATELQVASPPSGERRAAPGQLDATLARWQVTSPGVTGVTSDVRMTSYVMVLEDANGLRIADPRTVITRVRVVGPLQTLVDRSLSAADTAGVTLVFSPALNVPANTPLELQVHADLATAAPLGRYRLAILDSTRVSVSDPNSGASIPVRLATTPLHSDTLRIESRADTLRAHSTPGFPPTLPAGRIDALAVTALLRHPGAPTVGRVRVDGVALRVLDGARQLIAPSVVLDRVRATWNGVPIATEFDPPASVSPVVLAWPARYVEAGATDTVRIYVNVAGDAPLGLVELVIQGAEVAVRDANLGTFVALVGESPTSLPLSSGITRIEAASLLLVVGGQSLIPATVVGDGGEVAALRLTFANGAASGAGTVGFDRLAVRAVDDAGIAIPIGRIATGLTLRRGAVVWANRGGLSATDSIATLVAAAPIDVAVGTPEALELSLAPRNGASGRFRLSIEAADVGVLQPGGALSVAVLPAQGQAFPLRTESAGFADASLTGSYSNFPNPFAAGRTTTRFVFFVPASGRATLRIWTARGEAVATVLEDAAVATGLRQVDTWDGRNGRGDVVVNGAYVAELILRLDGGRTERALRRVAVVR